MMMTTDFVRDFRCVAFDMNRVYSIVEAASVISILSCKAESGHGGRKRIFDVHGGSLDVCNDAEGPELDFLLACCSLVAS